MLSLVALFSCYATTVLSAVDHAPIGSNALLDRGAAHGQYVKVSAQNNIALQKYTINLTVGNPPQPFSLMIDTGSADLWVPAQNSSGCNGTCPFETFDPSKDKTYQPIGETFNATYGTTPDLQIVGPYFNDTVRIDGDTIPNMTVAIGDITPIFAEDGYSGIVGLGSRLAEAIYRNNPKPNASQTHATIYEELQLYGYTASQAFSLWLNRITSEMGTLIFGGIDTTKYTGELVSLPVQLNNGIFTDWAVALTSVARVTENGTLSFTTDGYAISAILDSGSPNMYLPPALAQNISADMNATTYQGFPYVPCSVANRHEFIEFGLGGTDGPKIRVPYSELLYPYGDPSNIGPVTAADGTKLCYLGVIALDEDLVLLGHTFQRSAYLVFDPVNTHVAIAQATYDSEEHIITIPNGTALPGVTSTNTFLVPTATAS